MSDVVDNEGKAMPPPPKTFNAALEKFRAQVTDEDEAELDGKPPEGTEEEDATPGPRPPPQRPASATADPPAGLATPEARKTAPGAAAGADIPDWAIIPPDLKIPQGRQVYFLFFRASWTDTPDKGDRQCIIWNLTDADEKLALKRTQGQALRTASELAKQMIRSVDGEKSDWTQGAQANVEKFWREVGTKCRNIIIGVYHKNHHLNPEETADFFSNCFAVRTAKAG